MSIILFQISKGRWKQTVNNAKDPAMPSIHKNSKILVIDIFNNIFAIKIKITNIKYDENGLLCIQIPNNNQKLAQAQ